MKTAGEINAFVTFRTIILDQGFSNYVVTHWCATKRIIGVLQKVS